MVDPVREPAASTIAHEPDGVDDVTADVAFGTARTPSDRRATLVSVTASVAATGGSEGRVAIDVDGVTVGAIAIDTAAGALSGNPDVFGSETSTVAVPPGSSYTIRNVTDPNATNAIDAVHETTL